MSGRDADEPAVAGTAGGGPGRPGDGRPAPGDGRPAPGNGDGARGPGVVDRGSGPGGDDPRGDPDPGDDPRGDPGPRGADLGPGRPGDGAGGAGGSGVTVALGGPRARFGWLFAAVWLFYLSENLSALTARGNDWQRDLGLAALAGFGALYLAMVSWFSRAGSRQARLRGSPRVWAGLAAMLALTVAQVPGAGFHALTCLVYVASTAMASLPLVQAAPFAASLAVAAEVLAWRMPGWEDNGYGLGVLLGSAAVWGLRLAGERQARLAVAQEELAVMAVQQERARIAADLHDILGHSLTVVTVKAELAQRLLDVDVERARRELRDLEVLARDALSDVRATAMGVRGISLPGEIAAARAALAAAHVVAELPGAADEVPTRVRELFAWTIREAVTNVVRHSGASRCVVRLSPGSVEIVDDGPGDGPPAPDGQGLAGLRRRAEAAGARLVVGRRADGPGFRVRVEVPE
ncbi:sensor histidine kinase [Nucisporomicrobium flavum]|uniref:sensor histidine kinase n=1 Tax=Nucisporomicrobium flavum TaxID=2785915 RepID=UPI0027DB8767|nr:histidine kinase [Nucisporomicrobium flavum]